MFDPLGRTVTVIGANGFLGTPLVNQLIRLGATVRAFDRYSTTPRHEMSENTTVFQGDLMSRSSLAAAVAGAQDVFHFLSVTSPRDSAHDPVIDIATNVTAGVELFSLCSDAGVERVLFASSGGTVYGTSAPPHGEECPRSPVSPHGIGKVSLENYLQYFHHQRGLPSVSLRISNPYGPGQKPRKLQGIIPIALRAARDGVVLPQFGDGSMVRDYLFVDDLMTMILNVWRGHRHDAYNLGSGTGTALHEVFEVIERVTGRTLLLRNEPSPPSFVRASVLDTSRYVEEFGDSRRTSLEDGIRRTWEAVRDETLP
ncbi:NAD-dependent epimerase/dehydratase family protein [Amycolatopsis sp. FBCC-B4732]|uniref:NAD-dependent epimerase/dehydratase family protein n=1 Tax=unclassified Amycolatopsis TaxID=2618356 RepID=UPI001FF2BA16|nr:NAD-dependent epimerase/dehydratase family protein [Amycolatopsis sp. FBCC-B4732]UOX93088.1 NAD-dependent epimerase/dehydratase family protein [Amycolatopsis sp. FBCC-B4732]